MPWLRMGECNQCGECCKQVSHHLFTPNMDPNSPTRQFGCVYLEGKDSKYRCLIMEGDIDKGILSEEQRQWFKEDCELFPNPEDEGHRPPYKLPDKCGYRIFWTE